MYAPYYVCLFHKTTYSLAVIKFCLSPAKEMTSSHIYGLSYPKLNVSKKHVRTYGIIHTAP